MKIKTLSYCFMELIHMKVETLYRGMRFLSHAHRLQCPVLSTIVSLLFLHRDQF